MDAHPAVDPRPDLSTLEQLEDELAALQSELAQLDTDDTDETDEADGAES